MAEGLTRDSFGGSKNGLSGRQYGSHKGKFMTFCQKMAKTVKILEESPIKYGTVQKSALFRHFWTSRRRQRLPARQQWDGQGLEYPVHAHMVLRARALIGTGFWSQDDLDARRSPHGCRTTRRDTAFGLLAEQGLAMSV